MQGLSGWKGPQRRNGKLFADSHGRSFHCWFPPNGLDRTPLVRGGGKAGRDISSQLSSTWPFQLISVYFTGILTKPDKISLISCYLFTKQQVSIRPTVIEMLSFPQHQQCTVQISHSELLCFPIACFWSSNKGACHRRGGVPCL